MGDSWGHDLQQLSVQELFRLARRAHASQIRWPDWPSRVGLCVAGRVATHSEPGAYMSRYNYVTGRAGRVSWAERLLCAEHAEKFAKKHGLDLAAVPVEQIRPKHASEEAFEQLFSGGEGR